MTDTAKLRSQLEAVDAIYKLLQPLPHDLATKLGYDAVVFWRQKLAAEIASHEEADHEGKS